MAKIVGVAEGLMVASLPVQQPRVYEQPDIHRCDLCAGVIDIPKRSRSMRFQLEEGRCRHCSTFFGREGWGGVTNFTPERSAQQIAEIKAAQWAMILRRNNFGAENGATIEVEPGDIFKVARAGYDGGENEFCSAERTKQTFSISVNIGPYPLIQFPHEVAAITFLDIMKLRGEGQVLECYVAAEDECGHFKPTDEMRAEIYATFGAMVNAPMED